VTGGRATFVGRAYELALLKDSLAADAGRPWIVLAEGEPGMEGGPAAPASRAGELGRDHGGLQRDPGHPPAGHWSPR